jgi:hypothetical protein
MNKFRTGERIMPGQPADQIQGVTGQRGWAYRSAKRAHRLTEQPSKHCHATKHTAMQQNPTARQQTRSAD